MNNEQFKKGMRITAVISIIIFCVIIGILIYVFNSKKASTDLYSELLSNIGTSNMDITEISLEAKGINKKEFENYLSIFSNLVYNGYYMDYELTEEELKNTQILNMSINFLNNLYLYEDEKTEQNIITYDADKVNDIIKEMSGTYVYKNLEVKTIYNYDEAKNEYISQVQENINSLFIEIDELSKDENKIEVVYKASFPNEEEKLKFLEGKEIELETYTIKATILENEEYEYSKYYVSNIKQIAKETIKYN